MADNPGLEEQMAQIMENFDTSYRLMELYDEMPHKYGDSVLYQGESHTVEMIGREPGITTTELAVKMGKTPSASSQIIRKLKKKGFVYQKRNSDNNREYNLFLTDQGWGLYKAHAAVDEECGNRKLKRLAAFSEEELNIYIQIHRAINEEFEVDVRLAEKMSDTI